MNSSDRIAVQRYAAAYNNLSATNEQAELRAQQLQTAAKVLSSVQAYMTSPRVTTQQKKQVAAAALQTAPETASFIELLIEAKRYALLEAVAHRVGELLDARLGIVRAEVVSARALSREQQTRTEAALAERYGGKVKASFSTDASLLGGLKIRCQGELIDGSLQGRLTKLQEELTH